jgi:hypothetical protein
MAQLLQLQLVARLHVKATRNDGGPSFLFPPRVIPPRGVQLGLGQVLVRYKEANGVEGHKSDCWQWSSLMSTGTVELLFQYIALYLTSP